MKIFDTHFWCFYLATPLLCPRFCKMNTTPKVSIFYSATVADFCAKPDKNSSALIHPSVTSWVKRSIDIVGACVGLMLTALIAVPVMVAIYLDNPGPIFYSQIRCGLRGKPFRIWKFRSMVVNADRLKHTIANQAKGHIFKNDRDPRVTKVGRFLRRTSLDELPQFWNVLRGEMSLVGTRPPTPDEVKQYTSHHWQRLEVRPGVTGEWQANGRSSVTNFEDIVNLDLRYLERWSIAYDLQLILKTILVVVRRKGAY